MTKKPLFIALSLTLTAILVVGSIWLHYKTEAIEKSNRSPQTVAEPARVTPLAADYVGAELCATCHHSEYALWRGSHHDLAMQPATQSTVLGDFNHSEYKNDGIVSRFFRRDGNYVVTTDGADGRLQDFEINYTFGVYPLQQYLIEFPGGRLQALSIAWDSRPVKQGGQRWFHLHPDEQIAHDDVLHWTGPNQNWNYMCADCHSTNLRKNYTAGSDSYNTTWSEVNVACEACHGPGSNHIVWAKQHAKGASDKVPGKGLTVSLNERAGITWTTDPRTQKPRRSKAKITVTEIETCARCHSRRSQLSDEVTPGDPLMDHFRPQLLAEGLYHADGQIEDEVYVYGSFLQSKMHRAGVTCSDCHDPHAANLRQPGEQVCYRCHTPERYATKAHHFHPADTKGASCVACHMPAKNYMVVDPRHDHSLRIPRPDLSVRLGTPNACNMCHTDQSSQWAAQQMLNWYGKTPKGFQGFASALYAARQQLPQAKQLLTEVAADSSQPGIARATALAALGFYPDQNTLVQIQQGLRDNDPLLRLGALNGLESMGLQQRVMALPLLHDELRSVRIEAAGLLAGLPLEQLPVTERQALRQGIVEYIAVQQFNAERPESQVNLGGLYTGMGDFQKAEVAYRKALQLQPRFVPAYINMAQMLSERKRETEAEGLLRQGLSLMPDMAPLHHALGLSLIRQKKSPGDALASLAIAAELSPNVSRFSYVYGVALQSEGQVGKALQVLEAAHKRRSGDPDILYALVTFNRDAGQLEAARKYVEQLIVLVPGNPSILQLQRELEDR